MQLIVDVVINIRTVTCGQYIGSKIYVLVPEMQCPGFALVN